MQSDNLSGHSLELVDRFQQGDPAASEALFERYLGRLMRLVGSRLSARLAQRFDPEDVVQSAYASFFRGLREERLVILRSGDVWRLLVAITLNKLRRQVAHHQAAKRTVRVEAAGSLASRGLAEAGSAADTPTPDEVAGLVDEMERLLATLDPLQTQMLELRLQGYTCAEISAETGRCERTVRRLLERVRDELQMRWEQLATA